jgi:hypothetical protein
MTPEKLHFSTLLHWAWSFQHLNFGGHIQVIVGTKNKNFDYLLKQSVETLCIKALLVTEHGVLDSEWAPESTSSKLLPEGRQVLPDTTHWLKMAKWLCCSRWPQICLLESPTAGLILFSGGTQDVIVGKETQAWECGGLGPMPVCQCLWGQEQAWKCSCLSFPVPGWPFNYVPLFRFLIFKISSDRLGKYSIFRDIVVTSITFLVLSWVTYLTLLIWPSFSCLASSSPFLNLSGFLQNHFLYFILF